MINKNEELRDWVLDNKSFQDFAVNLTKFLESNKEFKLAVFSFK
jgi:hypothetical protein